jgi:Fe2+ transport system protein FeoA
MTLRDLGSGTRAVIKGVQGGHGLRRRLCDVGVRPGGTVEVLRSGAGGGPVLLATIHGARVAIGQRQAQRVDVELVDEG